jgi:hypothetical protein
LGETRRGFGNRIGRGDAERIETFLAGEAGEQGFGRSRVQKSGI